MAQRAQIKCINKPDRSNQYKHILNIGGKETKNWCISEEDAIRLMEAGEWGFFVSVGGHTIDVIIATHNNRKYLKTRPDGIMPDNLLKLPECPLP